MRRPSISPGSKGTWFWLYSLITQVHFFLKKAQDWIKSENGYTGQILDEVKKPYLSTNTVYENESGLDDLVKLLACSQLVWSSHYLFLALSDFSFVLIAILLYLSSYFGV